MFFNEKLNEFRNSAFKLVLPSKEISRREGFHRGILESLHGAVRRKFLLAYFRGFTAIGASFRNFENQFASLGMDVLNRDTTRNFLVFSFRYQSPDTPLEFYHASMCRNLIDIFDLN